MAAYMVAGYMAVCTAGYMEVDMVCRAVTMGCMDDKLYEFILIVTDYRF